MWSAMWQYVRATRNLPITHRSGPSTSLIARRRLRRRRKERPRCRPNLSPLAQKRAVMRRLRRVRGRGWRVRASEKKAPRHSGARGAGLATGSVEEVRPVNRAVHTAEHANNVPDQHGRPSGRRVCHSSPVLAVERQPSSLPSKCSNTPTQPPTSVPLRRMNCRSLPISSSIFSDTSRASQLFTTSVMSSEIWCL